MNSDSDTLKALYKTLKATQKKLHDAARGAREPIAIIGMACRFPGGASTLSSYRLLLEQGGDGIIEVPADRWNGARYYDPDPAAPGKVVTNRAGFLREPVDSFDCSFFHLSPREAQSMDPQQRLLLEVCWEAFENGGLDITAFKGSNTGVFCGIANSDYGRAHLRSGDPEKIDGYAATGTALSAAVGRISYLFGFEGPNMALDTACSSSLVAVHLACQSLRSGESDIALAAGVNLILTPEGQIGFSRLGALSSDGRCKSFDDAADGYGRGEGCGLVILKRLSDAERDGDSVMTLIRGTAVNQDGRTNGFTAPSGIAQEKVLRRALDNSGLRAEEIVYLEAHGTGTPLGDPIEMEAIAKVYAACRGEENPLYVGSAKANIGHLEAAAGIAGLIKAALVLEGKTIFPQANFTNPNRHIPWQNIAVRIPRTGIPLPGGDGARCAAVSSFGFSGTNAHVILQERPRDSERAPAAQRSHHILNLSAPDADGLQALAASYQEFLASGGIEEAGDLCHTAAVGRHHFSCRFAVTGKNREELRQGLADFLRGPDPATSPASGCREKGDRRIVFLFTGQGSQYYGMGADLYQTQPVFRECMDRCDELLRSRLDRSLIELLYGGEGNPSLLQETCYAQPVIAALEYSLAKMLESWGIRPSLVLGHSIGEYAAACIAGIVTLEDMLSLVALRGALQQSLPRNGAMAAIGAGEERLAEALARHGETVSLAAVNGPRNTVISGERQAVEEICRELHKEGLASHLLPVSHAFHSVLLDPVLEEFGNLAARISYSLPKIPIVATVTGMMDGKEMATPGYWTRQMRRPVRFADSMQTAGREGYEIFLEVGGTSTLTMLGRQCLPGNGKLWLTTLGSRNGSGNLKPGRVEGRSDWETLLPSLASLAVAGGDLDWAAFDRPYGFRKILLPNYPFQRRRCWLDLPGQGGNREEERPGRQGGSETAPEEVMDGRGETSDKRLSKSGSEANPTPVLPQRRERILSEVRNLMHQASEITVAPSDGDLNLFELGFASLMIARLKDLIKRAYGLEMKMSWFYSRTDSFNKIVDHIDRELVETPEAEADFPVEILSPSPARLAGNGDDLIGRQLELMRRQLQIMSEQLRAAGAEDTGAMSQLISRQATLLQAMNGGKPESAGDQDSSGGNGRENAGAKRRDYVAYRSVTGREKLELGLRQKEHLHHLIRRYTGLTARSKERTRQYRPVFANTRNIAGFRPEWKEMIYQIIAERAEGSHFVDGDGRDYLDISMGFGVYLFGHNPPFLQATLQEELRKGTPIGPMSDRAGGVATLIHELTGVERVAFFNTGTEAVMAAVRIARTVTARKKIALFSGSYHGHFDGVLAVKDYDGSIGKAAPMSPGTLPGMIQDVYVLDYETDEALRFIEARGRELAAVLVEPVQSRRPELQPKAFLRQLREITTATGAALIFDEMIIGFRLHPGGGQAWFGVQADIVTYGKVVGGGLPIGVVAGKARYLDAVDGGMWNYGDASFPERENTFIAGTFNHHPLAMAGAWEVLRHLKESGPALQENLNRRTEKLAERLNAYFTGEELPIRVTHFGSLFKIPLKGDQELLYYHLLARGIYIWEGRNCFLSTAHTDGDIEYLVEALQESVEEMRAGGLFSGRTGRNSVSDLSRRGAGEFPLSSGQMRLYTLSQLEGGERGYHIPVAFFLEGMVDAVLIEGCLKKLIRRHASLRTGFHLRGEAVFQRVEEEVPFSVEIRDAILSPEELAAEWLCPFDLALAPLIRVCLAPVAGRTFFLLDAHHIVLDGISADILIGDLLKLMQGEELPALQLTYQDYVEWEQSYLPSSECLNHEEYWRGVFSSEMPVLDLPTDRPRPAYKTFRGHRIFQEAMGRDKTATLKRFAAKNGSSLFIVLLAAYFTLLHKLTGQQDITVGTNFDGRKEGRFSGVIGMFTTTMAIRTRPGSEKRFGEFLQEVKDRVLEAFDCQDYPFEKIVEGLGIRRDISRNPLFDTIFVYEEIETRTINDAGLTIAKYDLDNRTATFDLTHEVLEIDGALHQSMEFNRDLFDEETIRRFLAFYQTILDRIIAEPDLRLADIDLLDPAERRRILVEFNDTATTPVSRTVTDLFEEQAHRTPDAQAVVFKDRSLTYGELNAKANSLAHHLRKQYGIGPDRFVGVLMQRSEWMIVAVLAVLKAGGAYVPLDPAYPAERIWYMLSECGCTVVLTAGEEKLIPPEGQASPPFLDVRETPPGSTENPLPSAGLGDLCYIIFTSGSTGKPKGCQIEHRNLAHYVSWAMEYYLEGREYGNFGLYTSLAFDLTVTGIFCTLLRGRRLTVYGEDMDILEILAHNLSPDTPIDCLKMTPSHVPLIKHLDLKRTNVRLAITGGEPLTSEQVRILRELNPQMRIVNEYGPTEYTVGCIVREIGAEDEPILIGRPIANTRVYILDERLALVPVGVVGEICLAGDGIARGYMNRSDLTNEKFVPNPFQAGERIYRSGDLGRWMPDGTIDCRGREDEQVKIHGYRIECGEIESALLELPGISEAIVLPREVEGDTVLVAYVAGIAVPAGASLRGLLRNTLPDYMIPAWFVQLEQLPLTSNGKIDRRSLPLPDVASEPAAASAQPESEEEKRLAEVWAEVLGRKTIGIDENFFELGGDSIKAIQIVSRLGSRGYKLEIPQLFMMPTIRELAPKVRLKKRVAEQGMVSGPVPLTAIQAWFFRDGRDDADHYAQAVLLRAAESVREPALRLSLQKLQEHHDALRMRVRCEGDTIVQEVAGLEYPLGFHVVDLRGKGEAERELERLCAEVPASLNLESGPLMETRLFRLDEGDRILIVIHHCAVDGVSWRIILEDLAACYDQALAGRGEPALPPKTDSYRLWAERITRYVSEPGLLAELSFWRESEECEALAIPPDFAAEVNCYEDVATLSTELNKQETELLLTRANRAYHTETSDLLLLGLGRALRKSYGVTGGFIELEGHGRESLFSDIDTGRTVGWFTSLYPVLLAVPDSEDLGCQLKELKEGLRRIPHKGIGYGILKYLTPGGRKELPSRRRARIVFNYLGSFDAGGEGPFHIDENPVGNTIGGARKRPTEIEIEGAVLSGRLKISISYSRRLHRKETAAAFLRSYADELGNIIDHCLSRNIDELSPHDLTCKELTLPELDDILADCGIPAGNLKDIYPLSPLQEGMLFHALLADGSLAYFQQISFGIEGELNLSCFEAGWNLLCARHDILRTVFVHKGLARPLQVCMRKAPIEFHHEDIRALSREEQQEYLLECKRREREEGLDLTAHVPLRLSVFTLGEGYAEVLWTYHHILLDGWCAGIIFHELFTAYSAYRQGGIPELEPAIPYSSYIQWLASLDRSASLAYWRTYLQDYDRPASLPRDYRTGQMAGFRQDTLTRELDGRTTADLKRFAAIRQVTLNTLFQTAWALVLNRYSGADDVVFGVTVSGRPAELADSEKMVGLFINTIPQRIRMSPAETLGELVREVQDDALRGEAHHYCSLAEIQTVSSLKQDLLDHVLVFENYPLAEELMVLEQKYSLGFGTANVNVSEQTNYDLTVVVEPGAVTGIAFHYNSAVFSREGMEEVGKTFESVLTSLARGRDMTVRELRQSLMSGTEKQERESFIKAALEISEDF